MLSARQWFPLLFLLTAPAVPANAQHGAMNGSKMGGDVVDARPAILEPHLGRFHHPVSTRSLQAQRFFDQGLTLAYGFNHEGAYRCFRQAARLDPTCAMAYWGMAQALSPNINDDVNLDWERAASQALDKALALPDVPEPESAYIQAQLLRHSRDPHADFRKHAVEYSKAMREVYRRWPDDPDAATLYVESLFNLHPWTLWTPDRKPTSQDTNEILFVLESVLRTYPDHIGANHYYVHALEPSPWPERAWASAKRLETLVPGQGHLRHMPSHVYMHTGDYEAAARSNEAAIAADRAYIKLYGAVGDYPMYLGHNIDFLRFAYTMAGRYHDAKKAADQLVGNIAAELAGMQQMSSRERYLAASLLVEARFYHWEEILASRPPDPKQPRTTALWRYARSLAYAARGEGDHAEAERARFAEAGQKIPAASGFGLNDWDSIFRISKQVLDAKIAVARGDFGTAVRQLREAVAMQDALAYDETPDWYYPIRESLGAVLLRAGQPADAEAVFRADLERNPRNGRSLYGLTESLRRQNDTVGAAFAEVQYQAAWRHADISLRIEDL